MSVYVDPVFHCVPSRRWRYEKACHLYATTVAELHAFAKRLGLKRGWFQLASTPHYDLTENKRRDAVRLGAIEHSSHEAVEAWRSLRCSEAKVCVECGCTMNHRGLCGECACEEDVQ